MLLNRYESFLIQKIVDLPIFVEFQFFLKAVIKKLKVDISI